MKPYYENIYLETSPVFDLLAAMLRIQCHEELTPENHEYHKYMPDELEQWVHETRKSMSADMKRDLEIFFNYESYLAMILVSYSWEKNIYKSIDSFIQLLESTPSLDLVRSFFATGYGESLRMKEIIWSLNSPDAVMDFIKGRNLPEAEKWKLFFMYHDADNTKGRLINLIRSFYEEYFIKQMDFISKLHEESIEQMKVILTNDIETKINSFCDIDFSQFKDLKQIVLIPSYYYLTAGLFSYYAEIEALIFLYGTRRPDIKFKEPIDDAKLIDSIKALSDENRIKIIRILNTTPSYGYELGQKLNLSNSTVAHHVSVLLSLGIITSKRIENKVYYEVNKESIKYILDRAGEFLT
ncbi:ArsR/SmtB family transcription factor [Alkaliphilus peptidifermentans]|uniref:DNA-binding transcriptional regulator, ArsR family n=1 Tax=Alkaliphilus peptidifermentans DSM 18978 TaxID=1120976 RepID=A0A1G5J3G8_9FIRM|nr:metalloregulator ArsR/SmtB family transcription factor [Alkaliphilus peptidifermentans]SCY82248.1 DNA-binding transcriptional regulator, ArsR family [Alkaliphilus peptidifermentans DSM 18978]